MTVDANELKGVLQTVRENDFEVEEERRLELLQACLEQTGSSDPELRDELIYATLAQWLDEKKYFDDAELNRILEVCLNEQHLTFRLGESGDDSVFTRSFSSLVIACLLRRHRDTPFLTAQGIGTVKARMLEYLLQEKDHRGLTEHGWAHAVAHAADVLDELAQCAELSEKDLEDILNTIAKLAASPLSVYICDEEERLTYAVKTVFENEKMTEPVLTSWLMEFGSLARHCPGHGAAEGYRCFVNLKHFLRALYFELEHHLEIENKPDFLDNINETLKLCYRLQTGQGET